MPPSARKRVGSVSLAADAHAPPALTVSTAFPPFSSSASPSPSSGAPFSSHVPIANKLGGVPGAGAPARSPMNYRPLYTPTHAYFANERLGADAARLPAWVWWWMLAATFLVGCDSLYSLSLEHAELKRFVPGLVEKLWTQYSTSDAGYSRNKEIKAACLSAGGWIVTQTKFNIVELLGQLAFLFLLKEGSAAALMTAAVTSVATLWKTLIYMSMIWHAPDPACVVPLLDCLGAVAAESSNAKTALAQTSCGMHFFNFQFNLWWIVMPLFVIWACWARVEAVLRSASK